MDNNFNVQIIPNITSFNIEDCVNWEKILSNFSHIIHLDVMDGKYVETKSPILGEMLNKFIRSKSNFNVHLMVDHIVPELEVIKNYQNVKLVYIHVEKFEISLLQSTYPFEIGLVINPNTNIEAFKNLYPEVKVIQFMLINPGKMGNPFIASALDKIIKVRELGFTGKVHIDGHVNKETINQILKYRPDILNVGSAISKSDDPEKSFNELKSIVNANNN